MRAGNVKEKEEAKEVIPTVKGGASDGVTQTRHALDSQPKVEINIAMTATEKEDVDVAINGWNYRIQRGKWVKVPRDVMLQLQNCVVTDYRLEPRPAPQEGNELVPFETLRFPFQSREVKTTEA